MVPPPARFIILTLVLIFGTASHAQIPIGGKRFQRSMVETGPKGEWVLYEKGAPQNEGTRRWLTKRVLVELQAGQDLAPLRAVAGVIKAEARGKYAVVEFGGAADEAIRGAERLKKAPGVKSAEPMLARKLFHRLVPNDPLFTYNASNAGYQWHLQNTGQNGATTGIDLKVVPTWDSYKGAGIRITNVNA